MDTQQAKSIVKNTFESPFNKGNFTIFAKNLLNHIEEAQFNYHGQYIPDSFKPFVRAYERIGKYKIDGKRIDILVVHLNKDTVIERARTTQRNFIAGYLEGKYGSDVPKDAALVAFVSPNTEDWRFSLVKLDYKLETRENGKTKIKEEFTPARRWSFLVGSNENSHTAQSQFLPILEEDEKNPSLEALEEAFNVEKVTKEFFTKYRELYDWTYETLEEIVKKDTKIKADFESKQVDLVNFSKKLLGQIVFLYFLQKKGWFGVERDSDWGTGSKRFLRDLFDKRIIPYNNFFNEILEPLFYDALARDRSDIGHYNALFKSKIPFLNGGLFDPINNYDWVHTDILLPNKLFSNSIKTKEGDIGNGIFDVFDRFNFTVREDEPLEKEVAVDPEMLGKVFENLLEVKDRKSKGTYYTPREIVSYMCQQSLINYLATELEGKVNKDDIETLIKHGEHVAEHEATVESKGRETRDYYYKLPDSIRENAKLIDKKLEDIKVCDPAIGSGAFPVGIMFEIVKARKVLNAYIKDYKRTLYNFKRDCIQNSLYGVDIDTSAVEIAKLRLWLSLVVDEEDIKQIKPLPNLDYKIVCGNSLLGYPFISAKTERIEELKNKFFDETRIKEKNLLRDQINKEIYELYKNSEKTLGYKVNFDFKINFSEVFRESKGFDVLIANPPYINIEKIDDNFKSQIFSIYKTCAGRTDIYIAFIEKSLDILKNLGTLIFIIPYSLTNQKYGTKLRKLLIDNYSVKEILDTSEYLVFANAVVKNIVLQILKAKPSFDTIIKVALSKEDFLNNRMKIHAVNQKFFLELKDYRFETKDLSNTSLIKSKIVKNAFLLEDICFVAYGARLNHKKKKINKGAYIFSDKKTNLKPFLEGKDIGRFHHCQSGWLNYKQEEHYNPMFPELFENEKLMLINVVKNKLRFTLDENHFYNSHTVINCVKWHLLNDVQYVSVRKNITYEKIEASKKYDNKFLLALLNSNVINWFFCNFLSEKLHIYPDDAKKLPIIKLSSSQQEPFIKVVNEILGITKSKSFLDDSKKTNKVNELEKMLDKLFYELYDLNENEIRIIEGINC